VESKDACLIRRDFFSLRIHKLLIDIDAALQTVGGSQCGKRFDPGDCAPFKGHVFQLPVHHHGTEDLVLKFEVIVAAAFFKFIVSSAVKDMICRTIIFSGGIAGDIQAGHKGSHLADHQACRNVMPDLIAVPIQFRPYTA
jgi:hypothetical protein